MTLSVYSAFAIVIGRRNVGEGDKILTLYTKQFGKKRVIAKGVRKISSRRAPHLELFSEGKITLHRGKSLDIVTDAESVCLYGNMSTTLEQVAMLYFVAEVIDKMTPENDPHEEVYYLLSHTLRAITEMKKETAQVFLTDFCDRLLGILGFREMQFRSRDFRFAVASIESVVERNLRTVKLLERSGII